MVVILITSKYPRLSVPTRCTVYLRKMSLQHSSYVCVLLGKQMLQN